MVWNIFISKIPSAIGTSPDICEEGDRRLKGTKCTTVTHIINPERIKGRVDSGEIWTQDVKNRAEGNFALKKKKFYQFDRM